MISINKASSKSLYEQLYEQMKSEILNEHYAAGEKLPATRQLAAEQDQPQAADPQPAHQAHQHTGPKDLQAACEPVGGGH